MLTAEVRSAEVQAVAEHILLPLVDRTAVAVHSADHTAVDSVWGGNLDSAGSRRGYFSLRSYPFPFP